MANKNWLIRTKNKQILGPATKQKVIELIEKGSITGHDEISCGNGYWFWVKEKDLLERYLYGDFPQTFNPISEANDVLTAKTSPDGITASFIESPQKAKSKVEDHLGNYLPSDNDLEYPDLEEDLFPEGEDEDYPDIDFIADPDAKQSVEELVDNFDEDTNILDNNTVPKLKNFSQEKTEANDLLDKKENFLFPTDDDLEYPDELLAIADQDAFKLDHEVVAPKLVEEDTFDFDIDPYESSTKNEPLEPLKRVEEEISFASDNQLGKEVDFSQGELDTRKISRPYNLPEKSEKDDFMKELKDDLDFQDDEFEEIKRRGTGSDRYLIYIAVLIILGIVSLVFYYKTVLNKPLPLVGISEVQAQTIQSLSKKKTSILTLV